MGCRAALAIVFVMLYPRVCCAAATAASGAASDPGLRAALTQVDAQLAAAVKERNLPGLSAGVVYGNELIWSKAYGFANLERRVPADAETIYEIGSVTKVFNAVMLMQLRDVGKLSLDDPIEKYLPEFGLKSSFPDAQPPTFRQVVSHTAGLPREYGFDTSHPGELRQFPTAVVLAGLQDKEMQYPAYSGFHYSNLGIYVIGQALQRIAGEPYQQYMREHVFAPLGMERTGWEYTAEMAPHRAVGYLPAQGKGPRQVAPLFMPGDFGASAGGIQSSVTDLAKFLSLQFGEGPAGGAQILGGTTLREMRAFVAPAPNWKWGYGIGWEVESYPGHNGICHSGGTHGFASKVRAVPDLKLGFVVLINTDTETDELSRKAVELLIPVFETLTAQVQGQTAPLPAYAAGFTGHYSGPFGEADLLIRDGRLLLITVEAGGAKGMPWVLRPRDEKTLLIVSGSGDFDGQTIAFQPATATEAASLRVLGVSFPRTGEARE